jgi:hypothetical protein
MSDINFTLIRELETEIAAFENLYLLFIKN